MQTKELEQQVKFFQSSVAKAFAERDNSLLEVFLILLVSQLCIYRYNAIYMTFAPLLAIFEIDSVRKRRSEKKQD